LNQYYDICNRHIGKTARITDRSGRVHVGRITRVTRNKVYIETGTDFMEDIILGANSATELRLASSPVSPLPNCFF
jgi:ferredoxin-fold anticodon binding domain-containing protein